MKIDRKKLELAMARACLDPAQLVKAAQIPRPSFNNALKGRGVRPATVGKIARGLGCDPAEIMQEEVPTHAQA